MNALELFKPITTFVFDVDGVLTDCSVMMMHGGLMGRRMSIRDGYAIQLAVKKDYRVIIISGSDLREVKERLNKLGVKDVLMGIDNKFECLQQLMRDYNISPEQILYMGDDIPDYRAMESIGLPTCPEDAVIEIKEISSYISPYKGGEGCVRDVMEKVLKLRGDWGLDPNIQSK